MCNAPLTPPGAIDVLTGVGPYIDTFYCHRSEANRLANCVLRTCLALIIEPMPKDGKSGLIDE